MLEVTTEGKFEKNVKICQKRGYDMNNLKAIIKQLASSTPLDPKHRDHKLEGNFLGYRECHIKNDWLLVYKKTKTHIILSRTGTHSDIFK